MTRIHELGNILKCPMILYTKAKVMFPYKESCWRINPFRENGSMYCLELFLLFFDTCPNKEEVLSMGLQKLKLVARKSKFTANCSILLGKNTQLIL